MASKVHLRARRSGVPQPQLPRGFTLPPQPLDHMLPVEVYVERQVTALAEQTQMTQLATFRLTAAEVGRRQDDLAAGVGVRRMVQHATAGIRGTALTAVLRTRQDGRAYHVTPVGGIVGTVPGHRRPFL